MSKKTFEPFLLKPIGKDYLWGGNRLKTEYNKKIDLEPLAETWECSTHPDGVSIVSSGEFSGKPLDEVIKEHSEMLGTHCKKFENFPIMVKFIDAKKDLSVQVHPNDEYAKIHENNSAGKTEMWYVLDATPDANLICGLNKNMTKEELREVLTQGKMEEYFEKTRIKKGDIFFIPAGQIHAICSGALVAEIQENSNITYRLYDYNRVDKNGKKRELHIDKALEVAKLEKNKKKRNTKKVIKYKKGYMVESVCNCKYFKVEKMILNTKNSMAEYKTNDLSFHVLLCIDGKGIMHFNKKTLEFCKGDCIFLPANSPIVNIEGNTNFLDINV